MSRHKRCTPACFSTVPISIPKRVVPGGMLFVGSRFAVCVGPSELAAGVGEFEEVPEDPAEVAEALVDNGLSPEMDEVAGGRIALAFGVGSEVAVGFASDTSLAPAVGPARFGATDALPCGPLELPGDFEAILCGPAGAC
jgi:hypothetical protein